MNKKRWTKVGSVIASKKDKNSTYIKIVNDVSLKKDQCLSVFDPRKRPNITEEQLSKIPPWVKLEIFLIED